MINNNNRVLEVHTEHVPQLKAIIEVLKEILTEVTFEFTKVPYKKHDNDKSISKDKYTKDKKKSSKVKDDNNEGGSGETQKYSGGIRVKTVNQTKSVLIDLKLDINEFSKFECKRKLYLGINLVVLFKLLKSVDKGDSLTLYYDDDNKQYLGITSYNTEKDTITEDKLKLMDLDLIQLNTQPLLFDASISMSANEFHKMCRDISNIAEYLEIQCTKSSLIFKCTGDNAKREKTYKNSDGEKHNINIMMNPNVSIVQGVYELKDLTLFNKCNNFCTAVEIMIKNEHPLILKYIVGTVGNCVLAISPTCGKSADELCSDEENSAININKITENFTSININDEITENYTGTIKYK